MTLTLISLSADRPKCVVLDAQSSGSNAISYIGAPKGPSSELDIAILSDDANAVRRRQCARSGGDMFFVKFTEFEHALQ